MAYGYNSVNHHAHSFWHDDGSDCVLSEYPFVYADKYYICYDVGILVYPVFLYICPASLSDEYVYI